MSWPTITCEVAFRSDPGDTPIWTDVSSYVRSFTTRRGRQHDHSEQDRPMPRINR